MKFRHWVVKIHGFIGIGMGLLLMVMGLTGAGIVFREELDPILSPALHRVIPQAQAVLIEAALEPVQANHPDLPLQFIIFPRTPTETYQIAMKDPNGHRLETFVNPYTGAVLGERIWEQSPLGFLYTLHEELLAGTPGMIVVGVSGVVLLLMSLTGLALWTGWRKLATGFKVRWHSPAALVNYDLHNVGGFISNVFLLILAATGIFIVFLHVMPVLNQPPEVAKLSAPKEGQIALSKLLAKADAAMPDGKTIMVVFPSLQPRTVTIHKKLPGQETGRFDLSSVQVDRYSGEVVNVERVLKPEGLFQVMLAAATLHFGTFGGLPTRILYVFVGFMPTVLFVTGLANWRRGRLLGPRRGSAIAQAQQPQKTSVQ